MNRKEFMEQLERLLTDIPKEERLEALTYYHGYFEDAGVENEERILRELESPEAVAAIIKADIGVENEKEYTERGYTDTRFGEREEVGNCQIRNNESGNNGGETGNATAQNNAGNVNSASRTALIVILAIITSPLWLSAAGVIAGGILAVVGVVVSVFIALAAVVLVFFIVGVLLTGVGVSFFPAGGIAVGLGLVGTGLILLALALGGTVACVWLFGRFLPWLFRGIITLCSKPFWRRRKAV